MVHMHHSWQYTEKTYLTIEISAHLCSLLLYSQQLGDTLYVHQMGELIMKISHIQRVEYYPAIKKNEIMIFKSKWMELKAIILREVIQTQKDKHVMFSLIYRYLSLGISTELQGNK